MMEIVTTSAVTATLPPAARAAVVLKSEQTRKELAELVKKSAGIVTIFNKDGREEAHRAAMTLKNTRVAIKNAGEMAREDAVAFSKAVIKEAGDLVSIIEPEEKRVLVLRDSWDEKIAAEKAAKIAAERARVEKIADAIKGIRERETDLIRLTKTAVEAQAQIDNLAALEITEEVYQERFQEAQMLRASVLDAMCMVRGTRFETEAAALAAEEARKAEAARIEAERAELARQRAEAAETARLVKIESDRIAAEQAAEAKRLAALAAAQEAELLRAREAEADRVAAEQAERNRVAAGTKRQLEAQQAAIAAERAAFAREQEEARERAEAAAKLERDHADALVMNADFDAAREAERVRLQELADQLLADNRLPLPESVTVRDSMIDDGAEPELTDDEIIQMVAECYGMTTAQAIQRLAAIDLAAAAAREVA